MSSQKLKIPSASPGVNDPSNRPLGVFSNLSGALAGSDWFVESIMVARRRDCQCNGRDGPYRTAFRPKSRPAARRRENNNNQQSVDVVPQNTNHNHTNSPPTPNLPEAIYSKRQIVRAVTVSRVRSKPHEKTRVLGDQAFSLSDKSATPIGRGFRKTIQTQEE